MDPFLSLYIDLFLTQLIINFTLLRTSSKKKKRKKISTYHSKLAIVYFTIGSRHLALRLRKFSPQQRFRRTRIHSGEKIHESIPILQPLL